MRSVARYIWLLLLLLSGAAFATADETAGIDIVYHIATLNNWEDIVREQLATVAKSGLGQACDSLTVTVVGEEIERVYPLFASLSFLDKVHIVHSGADLHLYEFPGIEMVQQIAQSKPNTHILYFHIKGVTRYGSRQERPVQLWRRYMEYFTVERWRACIDALKSADICGVEWLQHRSIFAGNFWWARASYLRTCQLLHGPLELRELYRHRRQTDRHQLSSIRTGLVCC